MPHHAPAAPSAVDLRALAFDATGSGLIVADATDPDLPVVDANAAFERLTGYARDEVLGRNCRFLQGPGTDPAAVARIRAALGAGREVVETLHNYRKDGTPFWNELRITPARDEAGRVTHFVGVQTDVTDRVEAEAALRASEERLRLALAAAGMATWDWDAATGRVVRSPGMAALYGVDETPSTDPHRYLPLIHPDDRPLVAAADRRLGEGDGAYAAEYRVVRPDGEVRWLREVGEAERDAAGRPRRVLGVTQDVTGRRRAEEEARAAADWFRTLVEELPALVYVEDLDATVAAGRRPYSYTSPRVGELLGYDAAEWEGVPGLWRSRLHPDDRERVLAEDARTEATGEPFRCDYRLLARDGRVVWLRDEAVLVRGPDGEPRFWLGIQLDVTAEKAAEQAAHAAERRFQTLVERLPAVVYVEAHGTDGATAYRYVSPAARAVLGQEPAAVVAAGGGWAAWIDPADRARVAAASGRAGSTGEPFAEEYRVRRPDGSVAWVRDEAVLVPGDGAEEPHWLGVMLDVTAQKRAEAELRASEARFRALAEHLPALVSLSEPTPQARTLYANPYVERLLGYPPAAYVALGASWPETIHPEDRRAVLAEVARVVAEGGPFTMEYRRLARDGRTVWVRDESVLVRDPDGTPRYWQTVQVDVTDQRRLREELAEREARLRTIFEAVDAGVVMQDATGTIVAANAAAARLLGLSLDQLLGRSSNDPRWHAVREDGSPLPAAEHPAIVALRTGRPQEGTVMGVQRPDAGLVWLAVNARPLIRPGATAPEAVVAAFVDVSAHKRAERELVAAKEAAEQASRLKSAFLSTMSHELRTPLTAIIGYADLLLEGLDGPLVPAQAEDVACIAQAADRLLGLVNDVLDLSKIEAGMLELRPEPVALGGVLAEVRPAVAPLAAAKGLALETDVDDGLVVEADPQRLHQILLNLVGNAVKFTERGAVRVSARAVAGCVELAVADTGIGIPAAAVGRIFDEFRQADGGTTRKYGGSGLGLAITKRLVELHDGSIAVESAPGMGSTFTVRLPDGRA